MKNLRWSVLLRWIVAFIWRTELDGRLDESILAFLPLRRIIISPSRFTDSDKKRKRKLGGSSYTMNCEILRYDVLQ